MSGQSVIHTEILTELQKKVLFKLGKALTNTDFYLGGGTALALQIGHRTSIDFDWFISRLGEPEVLLSRLKASNIDFNVVSIDIETVYLSIDTVQVSFIGYDYPLLQTKIFVQEYQAYLASPDDIACMKLSAIGSRGTKKDFIDLYFLIKNFKSLEEYLKLYARKFSTRDIGHILRSLVYFEDAESEPDIWMISPLIWDELKADIERFVREITPDRIE